MKLCIAVLGVIALQPFSAPRHFRLPPAELNLRLEAPIQRWDEAIPLGNGLLGGLIWGGGNVLRISLDRGDLWDERPAPGVPWELFNYRTLQELVRAQDWREISRIFDAPYSGAHPTKLPAGRIEVLLPEGSQPREFELSLADARAIVRFSNGQRAEAIYSATRPVAMMRLPAASKALQVRLVPPAAVSRLGYPQARRRIGENEWWFIQPAAEGLEYCVYAAMRRTGRWTLLAWTIASTADGHDPLARARRLVKRALADGWRRVYESHAAWWREFWGQSALWVPDEQALRHYYLVRYFYGAASRRGAPPMPLQGVWTADNGGLPPWKGDYHNDLNTQMTYIAYQAAGQFDEGRCFLDFLWDRLPRFRRFAREFFDAPGAAVPGVMTLAGNPLGGWAQYSCSPTMGAWLAHLFYLHWRYTADGRFLRERAYPWCREIAECLVHLLRRGDDGLLKLPLSSSPEAFENGPRSWLLPNSNFDLACMKMLFLALAEMAEELGRGDEAGRWRELGAQLGPLHVDADGALMLDARTQLTFSHRHLSNLMPIHPFNLITVDAGPEQRRIIDASLARWDKLGTSAWVGYSFSWMACLRARVGRGDEALRYLRIYLEAFISRNGFHLNGDQSGKGYSNFRYRPFTLEGNFLAMQAVHEMLLQSWSPLPGRPWGEVIRVFPAMPAAWQNAWFQDLRAEGGHKVSAEMRGGRLVRLRIVAGRSGPVRIRDNFGGAQPRWSLPAAKCGRDWIAHLRRGQVLEAVFESR